MIINKTVDSINKSILTIAEFIQPGKPLMIMGPYGSARYEYATRAVAFRNLKQKWFNCSFLDEWSQETFKTIMKTITGNTVMILDEVDKCAPDQKEFIIHHLSNPDRMTIVIARNHIDWVAKKCPNTIRMNQATPEQYAETGTFYIPTVDERLRA